MEADELTKASNHAERQAWFLIISVVITLVVITVLGIRLQNRS